MQIALGLLASLLIGTSDLLGAKSSGRTTALQTTTVAFLGGAVATAVVSPLLGTPSWDDLGVGALSGIAAFVALTTLWWGYARSSVGVAAPMAAVVSTVIPVLWSAIVDGDGPGALGWSGVAVGVVAVGLTSYAPGSREPRVGALLGALAGLWFAAMFLLAVNTSEDAGTWPVVGQRTTAFVLAATVGLVGGHRPISSDLVAVRWSVAAGGCGALGVASIVFGGQRGPIAPVIVAGSMYPAVAVALAWAFLDERLRPRQLVGMGAALVGVALIALD